MYPYIFSIEIPYFNINLEPRFYGLFYAISILISTKIVIKEVSRRQINLNNDEVMNMVIIIFFSGWLVEDFTK